jgi:hypothetical protein
VAASIYAFPLALIFVAVPGLVLVIYFENLRFVRGVFFYSVFGFAISPFVVWHLMVGGMDHFYYHPYNWFSVKYASLVVPTFWGNGLDLSVAGYSQVVGRILVTQVLEFWASVLVLPGLVFVWRKLGARAAIACAACIGLQLVTLIITRPSTHARYQYPLMPLIVLLASGGLYLVAGLFASMLRDRSSSDGRMDLTRQVVLLTCVVVAAVALHSAPSAPADAHTYYVARPERDRVYRDLQAISGIMGRSEGAVIARDSAIQEMRPENQVFTSVLLSEAEYVTYLTWPDDHSVLETFAKRNIQWVLIRKKVERWERDYNAWLPLAYGKEPQHYLRLPYSPAFRQLYDGYAYQLYRVADPSTVASYPR